MADSQTVQLCTFRLGDFLMAFDVGEVQEVVRDQPLTPVPLSSDMICGLMNLRGKVVMVVDLRKRFGFPDRDPSSPVTHVLYRNGDNVLSFLVDEVEDVITFAADSLRPPPVTMDEVAHELIRGTVQLPQRLLLVIDGNHCCDVSTDALNSAIPT